MNSAPRPASILIVDDTPANLQVLSEMLRGRGYKARPVPNGRLAIQAAQNDPPDLILLDVSMPELNGYEVCRRLKSSEQLRDIPVIFISALGDSSDKVRAFECGGVDYVTKPFNFEEVSARVATHLKIRDLQLRLQQQNQQLEQSFATLRKLEALRDNLTHMVIHDLKGPLTGITSYLELLADDASHWPSVPAAWHEMLSGARGCGDVLLGMIDDTLSVSRLESEQMPITLSACTAEALIRESVVSLGGVLQGRPVEVRTPSGDTPWQCDAKLIRRVIVNLLLNAARYSPENKPIVVQLTATPERVRVAVRDQGTGIPREYQQSIFEKFWQAQGADRHVPHSSGLGLTFCREAVSAHGGVIGVNSEPGQGSEFWFELPAPAISERQEQPCALVSAS